MNGSRVDPFFGGSLRGFSEPAGKGLGGDLRVTALAQPAEEAVGLGPNQRIPFGMGDDGMQAEELEFVQGLVHGGRDGVVGKFDEEIIFLVERVEGRMLADMLEIFEAQVEIAAGGDGETAVEAGLKFIPAHFYQFGNELVIGAGVRGGDDVRDAVADGHFSHGHGHFGIGGAVVKSWKYMAMNINH